MADDFDLPLLRKRWLRQHPSPQALQARDYIKEYRESLTPEEREAFDDYRAEYLRSRQDETLRTAEQRYQRWSAEEDYVLLSVEATIHEHALMLRRTFHSVAKRRTWLLDKLSRNEEITYGESHSSGLGGASQQQSAAASCNCATLDSDHEEWCAEYKE